VRSSNQAEQPRDRRFVQHGRSGHRYGFSPFRSASAPTLLLGGVALSCGVPGTALRACARATCARTRSPRVRLKPRSRNVSAVCVHGRPRRLTTPIVQVHPPAAVASKTEAGRCEVLRVQGRIEADTTSESRGRSASTVQDHCRRSRERAARWQSRRPSAVRRQHGIEHAGGFREEWRRAAHHVRPPNRRAACRQGVTGACKEVHGVPHGHRAHARSGSRRAGWFPPRKNPSVRLRNGGRGRPHRLSAVVR